jgi:hypothetical protein
MTQHNALSVYTDMFVPCSNALLHIAMMLPALHHMQQVNQAKMVRVSQASNNFDLCHVNIVLHEYRRCREQQPC